MGDVLVFAEYQHEHFPKSTLVAINAGLEMARKRSAQCVVVVVGDQIDAMAQKAAKYGAAKVIALEHPALANYLADAHAQALANLVQSIGAEYVMTTATARGKDLMPRLAARLDAPMASDIITINDDGTIIRPMYAGNGMATVEMDGPVKVITVRATAFDAAPESSAPSPVEKVAAEIDSSSLKMQFVTFNEIKSDRPQLTEAKIVISGSRAQVGGELQDRARTAG